MARLPSSTRAVSVWLDYLEAGWHKLEVELGVATWDLYTTGRSERLPQLKQVQAEVFSDESVYRHITAWEKQKLPLLLERRVQLARDYWLGSHLASRPDLAQLEHSITQRLNAGRVKLGSKILTDNQVRDELQYNPDRRVREKIWRAKAALGAPIERDLLKLVALRNKHARSLGYKNFFDMNLELSELTWSQVDGWMKTIERSTRGPQQHHRAEQASAMHLKTLMPWDVSYDYDGRVKRLRNKFSRNRLLPSLHTTYKRMGFDLKKHNIQWDLEHRPGKSQHAFCFGIDPPHDVRVLANLAPGARSYHVMFHEVGHAIYDVHLRQAEWLFRHPASAWWTEGIAEFFDRLRSPAWLKRELHFSARDLADSAALKPRALTSMLRFTIALIRFECDLYLGRTTSPRAHYARIMQEQLGYEVPVTADWATVPHFTVAPAYYFHYLLAEMAAAQLYETLVRRFGVNFANKPKTGEWLANKVFSEGCRVPAEQLIKQVTGKPLSPTGLLREVTA